MSAELVAKDQRWGRVPEADLPLRTRLLKVTPATVERLVAWAFRQWAVCGPWLLRRSRDYYEQLNHPDGPSDHTHLMCDATAAVDLLEWQSGCTGPKAAVEWLNGLETERTNTWT